MKRAHKKKQDFIHTQKIKQCNSSAKESKNKYRGYATHGKLKLFLLCGRGLTTHTHKNPNEKEKENGTSLGSVGSPSVRRHVPPQQPQKLEHEAGSTNERGSDDDKSTNNSTTSPVLFLSDPKTTTNERPPASARRTNERASTITSTTKTPEPRTASNHLVQPQPLRRTTANNQALTTTTN